MINEEKAKHLASRDMYGGFTLAEQNAAYQAAMAMAEWKDEEHAKEKQQWIDNVCNLMQHWILKYDYVDIIELEDYIKQQMKEL